ncbi:hypothetical protein [Hymenobacter defluvii]|uniref:CBM-cenC domain-containing protein n=1 Tax=Hymenobacter defluvii TaxID=2054411 RepID=A0ABS3TEV5_9BACT|nr:hypothetical protein [Hymenobacter defluvii]MBO3271898.1 hypothetical protein [Hymenobacter defluvii]
MSHSSSLRFWVLAMIGVLAACSIAADKAPTGDILVSNDFETLAGWMGATPVLTLTEEKAHSGWYSIKVDGSNEYSIGFNSTLGALHDVRVKKIRVSGWVFVPSEQATACLITHVGDAIPKTKPLLWDSFNMVKEVQGKYNQWVHVTKVLDIPMAADAYTNIGFYLWRNYASNQPVYFDDLVVTVEPGA